MSKAAEAKKVEPKATTPPTVPVLVRVTLADRLRIAHLLTR